MTKALVNSKAFIPSGSCFVVFGGVDSIENVHGPLDRIVWIVVEVAKARSDGNVVLSQTKDEILVLLTSNIEFGYIILKMFDKFDFQSL